MDLRRNIIASVLSQAYVVLLGIAVVPIYLDLLGAEGFGLVGFFTVVQALFNLLDAGLTATVARETARLRGGASNPERFGRLFAALEVLFGIIALAGAAALVIAADYVAYHWLNVETLAVDDVRIALQLMALAVALRWVSGVYRGLVSGTERLVWLSGFSAIFGTLRFVGVIPVMHVAGATTTVFFCFQMVLAVVELAGLYLKTGAVFPGGERVFKVAGLRELLRPIFRFSATAAITTAVWGLVTQMDRLLLSKLLPLAEFAYFTLGVVVAGGLIAIIGPVGSALLPRLAALEGAGDDGGMISVYRKTTRLVAAMVGLFGGMMFYYSRPLLLVWTGDAELSEKAAPILGYYALGNAAFCLSAFAYYLQYAKGDLDLHLIGNLGFLLVLVPVLYVIASALGAVGAAYTWFGLNCAYLLLWVPLVQRRFVSGLWKRWMARDVAPFLGVTLVAGHLISKWALPAIGADGSLGAIIMAGAMLSAVSGAFYFFYNRWCPVLSFRLKG